MPLLEIDFRIADLDCPAVLGRLAKTDTYADHSDSIRSISINRESETVSVSTWEVEFRGGLMTWTQRDEVDADAGVLRFVQLEGDSEVWEGTWTVAGDDGTCNATFSVAFDLGIPSLAEQLDPIAQAALYEVMVDVVKGMFAGSVEVLTPPPDVAA